MTKISKFWKFIEKIMTSGSGVSSKRFNGTYGFTVVQIIIIFIVVFEMIKDSHISDITSTLVKIDLYVSASLLGLGILDKFKQI